MIPDIDVNAELAREDSDGEDRGKWVPIPEGTYDLTINKADWHAPKGGAPFLQVEVEASVSQGGARPRKMKSRIRLYHTRANGDPIAFQRRRIAELAYACKAVTAKGRPDVAGMAGNVVRATLGIEKGNNDFVTNVFKSIGEKGSRPPASGPAQGQQRSGGRYQRPEGGDGDGSQVHDGSTQPPDDFDDDIPFASVGYCPTRSRRSPLASAAVDAPW